MTFSVLFGKPYYFGNIRNMSFAANLDTKIKVKASGTGYVHYVESQNFVSTFFNILIEKINDCNLYELNYLRNHKNNNFVFGSRFKTIVSEKCIQYY